MKNRWLAFITVLCLSSYPQVYADALFVPENGSVVVSSNSTVYGAKGNETVAITGVPEVTIDGNIENLVLPEVLSSYRFAVNGTVITILKGNAPLVTFLGLNQTVRVTLADGYTDLVLSGLGLARLGEAVLGSKANSVITTLTPISDSVMDSCPEPTDEAPESPGPYDHVVSVVTSTDGRIFTGTRPSLLEHASAPDAVIGPDGKIWIYYMNGIPGKRGIFVAKVEGDGSLAPFDCIRIDNHVDENAVDPDVLRLDDGSYRLFWNHLVSINPGPEEGVYTATSTDGIHFTGKKQLFQHAGAIHPSGVRLDNGQWVLAFMDEVSTYVGISSDGENFQFVNQFSPAIPDLIFLPETKEVLMYTWELNGLLVRSSLDSGINWTDLEASAPGTLAPSILRRSPTEWSLYHVFHTVFP